MIAMTINKCMFLFVAIQRRLFRVFLSNTPMVSIIFFKNSVAGKYRRGDEDSIPRPPTAVCSDFVTAVEHILTWQ